MTVESGAGRVNDRVGSRLLPVQGGELMIASATKGRVGRLLARRLGLPTDPSTASRGSLHIEASEADCSEQEHWTRTIGLRRWSSGLRTGADDTVVEVVGFFTLVFSVEQEPFQTTTTSLKSIAIGPVHLPVLRWFRVAAQIAPDATTEVAIHVPGGFCTYVATFTGPALETTGVAE